MWTFNGNPVAKTKRQNCVHVTSWGGDDLRKVFDVLGRATPVS